MMNSLNMRKNQHGLSLIELMVAMALSLILMAGVFQIFVGNKKSFELTRDLSDMQENGRMALTFLSESVRMADHWAGLEGGDVSSSAALTGGLTGDCDLVWMFDTAVALQGFEGGTTADTDIDDCLGNNYLPNTDVLVMRYADGRELVSDAELADASNASKVYIRLSLTDGGQIVNGADSGAVIADIPAGNGVQTFPYAAELYFIRACSMENAGVCIDDIPTLVRLSLSGDNYVQQPLVEGVEQVQYDYGVDTDDDLVVDDYVASGGVADWDEVMSVRISVIARASQIDIEVTDANTYDMAGNYTHTADVAVNQFRRKQYNREVHVRNRSRL